MRRGDYRNYYKGHMDKSKERVEAREGGEFGWGWGEGWGENGNNSNGTAIKKILFKKHKKIRIKCLLMR